MTLPAESFAELAAELARIARDKAQAAEASEIMVATIEAQGEREAGAPVTHSGMRGAVASLKRRAVLAGRAADMLRALAGHEREIRRMLGGGG